MLNTGSGRLVIPRYKTMSDEPLGRFTIVIGIEESVAVEHEGGALGYPYEYGAQVEVEIGPLW